MSECFEYFWEWQDNIRSYLL